MLRALHCWICVCHAGLLETESVLYTAVVEVALCYGFWIHLLSGSHVALVLKVELAARVRHVEVLLAATCHSLFLLVAASEVAHRAVHGRQHGQLLATLVSDERPVSLLLATLRRIEGYLGQLSL